jgi:hypothetical protein
MTDAYHAGSTVEAEAALLALAKELDRTLTVGPNTRGGKSLASTNRGQPAVGLTLRSGA